MISVVIPVFNNEAVLGRQLQALCAERADDDIEIVVADNGSTDGTRAEVRRWTAEDPRVRLVDASARRGPSSARNIGARTATGERLVFCDGDDVVSAGWLATMVQSLDGADIVVGSLDVTTLDGLPPAPPIDPWPRQFSWLPAGLAANMAVHRAAFEDVGGFDEALRVGEDLDLCWRMQLRGYHLERRLDAVVAKRGRQDRRGLVVQSIGYGRSDAALYRRYRSDGMPRGVSRTIRTWAWLVLKGPWKWTAWDRRNWLRVLCIQVGRLVGCVEQRVFYP